MLTWFKLISGWIYSFVTRFLTAFLLLKLLYCSRVILLFCRFFISSVGNKQTFIWWLDYEIKLNLFSYWFSAVVRQMNVRMYFTPQVNRFNWIRLNSFAVFLPAWLLNTQLMIKKHISSIYLSRVLTFFLYRTVNLFSL